MDRRRARQILWGQPMNLLNIMANAACIIIAIGAMWAALSEKLKKQRGISGTLVLAMLGMSALGNVSARLHGTTEMWMDVAFCLAALWFFFRFVFSPGRCGCKRKEGKYNRNTSLS